VLGLPRRPEVFPPKRAVEPDDLPYTLRLPGRHHRRPHYTRVWNWEASDGENQWLEGGDAIEALLALRPAPLTVLSAPETTETAPEKSREKKKESRQKPRVCVDLDGVLAKYDGWKGADKIGPPLPGALEFVNELAEIADIIVFTSRCSSEGIEERSDGIGTPGNAKVRVIDWLERNNFPFTDVYVGQGKPLAAVFIDDRAVNCSPQKDPEAFEKTLKSARGLLKRRSKVSK
jgi:hypothetical protein